MDTGKNQKAQSGKLKSILFVNLIFAGLFFVNQKAIADLATPFVEVNNQVGDISEAHGWVVASGSTLEESDSFLVIVLTDTMDHVVLRAAAAKGLVREFVLGRWVLVKAEVAERYGDPRTDPSKIKLKILSVETIEERNAKHRKEYERLMSIEPNAQKKLQQSKTIRFRIETVSEGLLGFWIASERLEPLNIVVSVSDFGFKTTDEDVQPLSELTEVKYISLSGTKITDKALSYMAGLKKLETLYIGDTKITDSGLVYLKDLTNLRELWLRGNNITDNGIKNLEKMSKLESLDVCRTSFGDESIKIISDLASLKSLDISSTNVTDKSIVLLKYLKNLESLNLYNTKTTQDGRNQLVKAIPGLKINVEAPPIKH
jgi:hypothetical protein